MKTPELLRGFFFGILRAKELGLRRDCSNKAIPDQTRCETCAEKQRQARRRNEEPSGERKPPRTD